MSVRPRVDGKFLEAGGERLLIKGVTYGTFAPRDGHQYPEPARIDQDFGLMAAHGINTVRTYTVPPPWLLDSAAQHGLWVMPGIPWSQHIAFLKNRRSAREIRQSTIRNVRELAAHPAVLLLALGNEIPPSIVRWHGRANIERFIRDLYSEAKDVAPDSLLTYVNFPPTEYLELPFLDVFAFNVYLHKESDLRAYVARLQVLAGIKPLLLAELGADSYRNGEAIQAELTAMQLDGAFREGACGAIAFAWTDEWWRGGFSVDDWKFGLVDSDRQPKWALSAVQSVYTSAPYAAPERSAWPKVSVVVCAYNAADTIDECLTSLGRQTYPNYEVLVVNDGSRDATSAIAARHAGVRVIDVPNGGLSAARNLGLEQATGEIVAYTDADVRADRDWLTYLVQPFLNSDVAASGGPNVVPPEDPWVAQCIARAPGAPTHVLLDNRTAEHVPGCNMAFRRDVLLAIDGFNPIYVRAGDDVDVCWRLQARGWKVGFSPAALVWHHHRASIRAYWRQQVGYGEGEEWLLPHHPDRFENGQAVWRGHIYSALPFVRALRRSEVNSGTWGTALFPSVYLRDAYPFSFMPHKIRWQATAFLLALGGLIAAVWGHAELGLVLASLGVAGILTTLVKCLVFAAHSDVSMLPRIGRLSRTGSRWLYRLTIAWLHFVQPLARFTGRVRGLLSDVNPVVPESAAVRLGRPSWRHVLRAPSLLMGFRTERHFWGEQWTEIETFLAAVRDGLRRTQGIGSVQVDDGWQDDRDVSVQAGRWGWLDVRALLEDHGSGKRLARVGFRVRVVPRGLLQFAGVLALFPLGVVVNILWGSALSPYAALALIAGGFSMWGWRAARTLAATESAVVRAASSCGLQPVGQPARAAEKPEPAAALRTSSR